MNRFNDPATVAVGVRHPAPRASLTCDLVSFSRFARGWVAAMCLVVGMPCMAQAGQPISEDVLRSPERASALVTGSQKEAYRKVLSAYAREETAHPDVVALVMARCQFAEGFADSEENPWADDAHADFQSCQKSLEDRFHDNAEAILYVAEHRYGKEALSFAETLLPDSDHWTVQQRARLHVVLSRGHQATNQPKLAGAEALASVRLGPGSDQLVPALRYLCDAGQRDEAESLLAKAPVPSYVWMKSGRVRFAVDNLSPAAALAELQRAGTTKATIDPRLAANVYLRAGMNAKAEEALSRVKVKPANQTADQYRLRVNVAVLQRDGQAASTALQDWFGTTGITVPLLFAYGTLLGHEPWLLLSLPLAPLALATLALLVFLACLPGLLAFPAQYRGTVRARFHKLSPPMFTPIGLRYMWLGLGAFLVATTLLPMLWAGSALQAMTGTRPLSAGEEIVVVVVQLAVLAGGALFLLPAVRHLPWRAWIGVRGLKPALITVLAWTLFEAFALWAASQAGQRWESAHSTLHDRSVATLVAAAAHIGGTGLAMLMVAVLVPIYEELVFRVF